MASVVTTLLDFILELLGDHEAARGFQRDPHAALVQAGLTDVTPADVDAAMAMVADCSPVRDWHGALAPVHHDSDVRDHQRPDHHDKHHDRDDHDQHHDREDHDQGHEFAVIQHLQQIQNVSITEVDASHDNWVGGDVNVLFEDSVLNTGGGVVLNDVHSKGHVTVDNTLVDVDLEDSLNGSLNHIEGDGNATGVGKDVDNSQDNDVNSDNTDSIAGNAGAAQIGDNLGSNNHTDRGNVNAAGGDQHVGDETEIGDITVQDNQVAGGDGAQASGDDIDNSDNSIDDSFTAEDSFSTDDSFNTDASVHTDNSIDDSFDNNDVAGDDLDQSHDFLSDNAVAVDDSAATTGDTLPIP